MIYCHSDIVSKIGVTFTLLDNEIRMKQTVTQSPEFGQKSDSHLQGYYQQLHAYEGFPASVLVLQ